MLILTRRQGERIVIDADIEVTVVGVQGSKVILGIDAPKWMRVDRLEVRQRMTKSLGEFEVGLATAASEV
ncbi:MAG: carbon storage regulator [Gemmataceae bacterium]|nr:carbon storage regulator [Gemmataceae bacterium]